MDQNNNKIIKKEEATEWITNNIVGNPTKNDLDK